MKTRSLITAALLAAGIQAAPAQAAEYVIDSDKAHAFIEFRISHLGYSWVIGTFEDFEGRFEYDPDRPGDASIEVEIDPASVDTNHAERDKHLRGEDFLHVEKYPEARFVSTDYQPDGDGTGTLEGELTLHGETRPVTIEVTELGAGEDPWGGYRRGFEGTTSIKLRDFGIDYDLGPASREVHLFLTLEGIRQ